MVNREYNSYKDYPKDEWRWANFSPRELRSKGDGKLMVDPDSLDKLQNLRDILGVPMRVTSSYRSPAHNKRVGGAKHSMHLKAKAFDVQMEGHDLAEFVTQAKRVGFTGFGYYPQHNFIHIDTGRPRSWGKRWF
jgi:uncharacterized protein YcbK (DUF882 family)